MTPIRYSRMHIKHLRATRASIPTVFGVAVVAFIGACSRSPEPRATVASAGNVTESPAVVVRDTTIDDVLTASGIATPVQQATVSTKLMGSITEVLVREGDIVASGQPLVRIDARDLAAKQAQVAASIAEAEAVQRDATTQAARIRALYADSAATRAQLDAVETGLARANAAVAAAHSASAELQAVSSYSVISAPFGGVVTKRFVDPGAFAAPGAPLVTIQDVSRLRIAASATPDAAARLRRGSAITGSIERVPVRAIVEGVVPSTGAIYTVNAIVENPARALIAGGSASIEIPNGSHRGILVPVSAVRREGDLTGVTVRGSDGDGVRWVRLGRTIGDAVEVTSGLRVGDRIVVAVPAVAIGSN